MNYDLHPPRPTYNILVYNYVQPSLHIFYCLSCNPGQFELKCSSLTRSVCRWRETEWKKHWLTVNECEWEWRQYIWDLVLCFCSYCQLSFFHYYTVHVGARVQTERVFIGKSVCLLKCCCTPTSRFWNPDRWYQKLSAVTANPEFSKLEPLFRRNLLEAMLCKCHLFSISKLWRTDINTE